MSKNVTQIQEIETQPNVVSRPVRPCRFWENLMTLKTLVIVFAIIIIRDSGIVFYLLTH